MIIPETEVASKIERVPYGINSLNIGPKFCAWKPLQIKTTIVEVGNKIFKNWNQISKMRHNFTDQNWSW